MEVNEKIRVLICECCNTEIEESYLDECWVRTEEGRNKIFCTQDCLSRWVGEELNSEQWVDESEEELNEIMKVYGTDLEKGVQK